MAAAITPNQYTLNNHQIKITYLTSGFQGQPTLSFEEAGPVQNFKGSEIRVLDTEIGKLVSITIHKSVDTGSTAFSMLIPIISLLNARTRQDFQTVGVKTAIKTELVLPATGQRETYHVERLNGVAAVVETALSQSGA